MRHLALPMLWLLALSACPAPLPQNDPNPPVISWGVLDRQLNQNSNFAATGGAFSTQGHTFNVAIQADNPGGVQKITLDGSGNFSCSTRPDRNGQFFTAPDPLLVKIPHQESTLSANNGQVQTHAFLLYVLDSSNLSCGFHHYNGTPGNLEYFATSGTLQFSGSAQNFFAKVSTGSLAANL